MATGLSKTCQTCHVEKPVKSFKKYSSGNRGNECNSCRYKREPNRRAQVAAWQRSNAERVRESRYLRQYGVDIAWYESQLEMQTGRCAICGRTDPGSSRIRYFSVDHDHTTNQIRGLLCFPCNAAVGYLQDNPWLMESAALYLRSYQ